MNLYIYKVVYQYIKVVYQYIKVANQDIKIYMEIYINNTLYISKGDMLYVYMW